MDPSESNEELSMNELTPNVSHHILEIPHHKFLF